MGGASVNGLCQQDGLFALSVNRHSVLYLSFCRCSVKKKNRWILYRKVKSPSCSDQSDLNAPDLIITICWLVSKYERPRRTWTQQETPGLANPCVWLYSAADSVDNSTLTTACHVTVTSHYSFSFLFYSHDSPHQFLSLSRSALVVKIVQFILKHHNLLAACWCHKWHQTSALKLRCVLLWCYCSSTHLCSSKDEGQILLSTCMDAAVWWTSPDSGDTQLLQFRSIY